MLLILDTIMGWYSRASKQKSIIKAMLKASNKSLYQSGGEGGPHRFHTAVTAAC
jgi:hypothetical protein